MAEDKKVLNNIQNILLENRNKMNISGVDDIVNFDESMVCVNTQMGRLTVKGTGLRLNKLNLDSTELLIEGNIVSIIYSESYSKTGVFQKLFK